MVEVAVDLVGEVVGQQVAEVGARRVGLLEDAGPVLVGQGLLVAEAADAGEGAEVVVEGPVLLHQDHHVLDVGDRAGPALGERLGGRRAAADAGVGDAAGDAGRRRRRGGAERGVGQETASGDARNDRLARLPGRSGAVRMIT